MKVLLDENLPVQLASELQRLGHTVETVKSLRMKGIANGALLAFALQEFELCFSKDADLANARENHVS